MVGHVHHPYRHQQSQEEDVREEEQRTADPANKGSTGGACQEGHGCIMQTLALVWCRARVREAM